MKRLVLGLLLLCPFGLRAQDAAQPTLPTVSLSVDGHKIVAEVADDTQERTTGLMFRTGLAKDSGMVFVMPAPERAIFWMKNTRIPLSVAYIDGDGKILEIYPLKPFDETPVPSRFPNIAYGLEMEQGWFEKNNVLPGDLIGGLPAAPR